MIERYRTYTDLKGYKLRIAGIEQESVVDGPGMRFVVFVQGCPHHCEGCHNPETHDFTQGTEITVEEIFDRIKKNKLLSGVTFSGGEPFCQAEALAKLGARVREEKLNVMTYSGFTYEQLLEKAKKDKGVHDLLACTNILIDGPFILAQRNLAIKFRGSTNQRMLDITCYPNTTEPTVL